MIQKSQTTTWNVKKTVNTGMNYQPQLVTLPDFFTINSIKGLTKFTDSSKISQKHRCSESIPWTFQPRKVGENPQRYGFSWPYEIRQLAPHARPIRWTDLKSLHNLWEFLIDKDVTCIYMFRYIYIHIFM